MQREAVTRPAPLIQTVIVFPRYLKRFPISLHGILLMMAFERNVRRLVTESRAQSRHAFLHAMPMAFFGRYIEVTPPSRLV